MSNVETVQATYDAFGRGEIEAILDQLADDVEWDQDEPGYGVWTFGDDGKLTRFFHCIDRHAFVLAYQ